MKISCRPSSVSGAGYPIYDQLMQYMAKTDEIIIDNPTGDVAFIWSVLWFGRMSRNKHWWDIYRGSNRNVIVAEVGGLVRDKSWRLSVNGIVGDATFPKIVQYDRDRPAKLGLSLKPWHSGDYVLICGQHGRSHLWDGMPEMNEYYKQTVLEVRKYTDRPIVIRSHPRFRENLFFKIDREFFDDYKVEWNSPKQIVNTYDSFDLEHVLKHSHCVISHSSNSGVAAIINGVPAIVNNTSLAYPVATDQISNIESLPMPDREQWLIELSHKEWLEDELEQAWSRLRTIL